MKVLQTITVLLFAAALLLYGGSEIYDRLFVDSTAPVLSCDSDTVDIGLNDGKDALLRGVTAHDNKDGDLTDQIMVQGVTQLLGDNTARVTYVVFDSANNMATCRRTVRYTNYEKPRFALTERLVYTTQEPLQLLSRLTATDVVDGDVSGNLRIVSQNIYPGQAGTYSVTVQVSNSLGDSDTVELKVVVTEPENRCELELSEYIVYLRQGDGFDPDDYVVSPAAWAVSAEHEVDTAVPGTYFVCYTYDDDTVYQTVIVK